ncbi:hypothetical protein KLP28_09890 [Nocardioidaceae bacterium]|nr:hypothetical protein KLP28_09890 [Nocardioidaceae bacterium]
MTTSTPLGAAAGACPCGRPAAYAACCGPLHDRAREATTAEELMRSRYAAYATGREDHLFRTWHPRTRPDRVTATPGTTWTGLTVLDVVDGGPDDTHGVVEFRATWHDVDGGAGALHERSRFERRAHRWVYVDGDPVQTP